MALQTDPLPNGPIVSGNGSRPEGLPYRPGDDKTSLQQATCRYAAEPWVVEHSRAGRSPGTPERENLAGLVERVTFHNEESGFSVLRVKARGHLDLITVIGHAATIGAGEFVQASGRWVNDRTLGSAV